MSIQQAFHIIKARFWTIMAILAISFITAAVISAIKDPIFIAQTALIIDFEEPEDNLVLPALLQPDYMATQIGIIQSRHVALKVIDELKLTEMPTFQDAFHESTGGEGSIHDWLATKLVENLEVETDKSRLVKIRYRSSDPELSAKVTNAFAQAFITANLELSVEPARKGVQWIDEQLTDLREKLQDAQSRITAYQQKTGIIATDEHLDIETEHLNTLTSQLASAQAEAKDAEQHLKELNRFRTSDVGLETLPDVLDNSYIQALKADLRSKEAELGSLSSQMGKQHPTYKQVAAETANLRSKLKAEMGMVVKGLENQAESVKSREKALMEAQATQKAKVLELKQVRDQLLPLMREAESAQRNYDDVLGRYQQYSMQSRLNQTNITILNPAIVPTDPAQPKLILNLGLAAVLGLILGIIVVLILEFRDKRIHTQSDLATASGIPLLSVLPRS